MGAARLWATSDLHVAYAENRRIVAERLVPQADGDWLLVAGDVAETVGELEWALGLLAERFARVVWAPGNHELWTPRQDPVRLRGQARYEHLVAACRRLGVLTPEDDYPTWDGPGGPVTVAPLLLLYDYSFRPAGTTVPEALAAAYAARVVARDEDLLHPDPWPDRAAWCHARVAATEAPARRPARRHQDGAGQPLPAHPGAHPGPAAPGVLAVVRHRADRGLAPAVQRRRGRLRPPAHPADQLGGRRPLRGGLDRLPAGVASAPAAPRGAAGRAAGRRPVIAELLPAAVVAVEAFGPVPGAALLPEEEPLIARAVDRRREEFTTARGCARQALAELGVPPAPLLAGPRREPLWPAGVVGSLTHCDGYRAAAVARSTDLAAIGIDAEPDQPLPDGVLARVALAEERDALGRLRAGAHADRLLFSAKESVFKAWYPLARRWLGFTDAVVDLDPGGSFRVRLLVPGPELGGRELRGLAGRWAAAGGLLVTAVTLPAPR